MRKVKLKFKSAILRAYWYRHKNLSVIKERLDWVDSMLTKIIWDEP